MRMRGKRGTILILLMLAAAILSQSLITPSASLEYPAIYIDPATIGPNGYGIGTTFNISICTNYTGADIWGWRFTLTYNPLVLNGTGVFNGNLTTDPPYPAVFKAGNFTEYTGELSATEGSFEVDPFASPPTNVTSGPGILATVTFKVVGLGDSDIKLGDETKLIGYVGGEFYDIVDALIMPGNIGHSYFRNVAVPTHDIAVISVEPNVTKVLAPASVSINVTVKNNGTANERFVVEVYYEKIQAEYFIGEAMVDNLTAAAFWSNVFTWDTTYVEQGNNTIIAKAGPVARENVTANNQNEAWVNVYSPYIAVVPESKINPDLGVGDTYFVSIYTDYNATEVVGSNDTWGYELTLTYNASVLEGLNVTNGGNMPQTDKWVGNGTRKTFFTTITPIVSGSETVQGWEMINETLTKVDLGTYDINYATGNITFTTAPPWDVLVEVEYWYAMSLMPGATFTAGSFVDGSLTLTKANFTGLVSGPGVLATVNFNVTAIGESDITLGNETVLIGYGSFKNITMRHRLKKGYFANMGDAEMSKVSLVKMYWGPAKIQAYPTWLQTVNITVEVRNVWGAPNFTVFAYYGETVDIEIGNETVTNLVGKKTVTFYWNVSAVNCSLYTISAKVVVPTGDHNELNDYDSDGTVLVKGPGDADSTGIVDYKDLGLLAASYNSADSGPRWNPDCDFNCDYIVDYKDLGLIAAYYGQTC